MPNPEPTCTEFAVTMSDSYGDSWNGNVLYIGDHTFTLESGSFGTATVCLDAGTYEPYVCGGSWDSEVSWTVGGVSGGADNSCVASSGSFNVAPITPGPTPEPTISPRPTLGPTQEPTQEPTHSLMPIPEPTQEPTNGPCTEFAVTMSDSYGDSWNGNVLHIGDHTVTLESGSFGTATVCLSVGSYEPYVCGGGWDSEVSWTVGGVSGGADDSCVASSGSFNVATNTRGPTPTPTLSLPPTQLVPDPSHEWVKSNF